MIFRQFPGNFREFDQNFGNLIKISGICYLKFFEIFQTTESEIHFTLKNMFLPNFTEIYEKTTGNSENSIFGIL